MLRFNNSSVTFGPHPFVLTQTRQGIMFSSVGTNSETLVSERGILLAPVMTGYLENSPYSALAFSRDGKLFVVLFNGHSPEVLDTLYVLKGEMLIQAFASDKGLTVLTEHKAIFISWETRDIVYKVPYDGVRLLVHTLQFGKDTAALLTSRDEIYFPEENLYYSNIKSLSKTVFFAPYTQQKFYRILQSKMTGNKFIYLNSNNMCQRLLHVKTDAERFYNFEDYIAWRERTDSVFLHKVSDNCFSIPLFSENLCNSFQPIIYKDEPAVCELIQLENYELFVQVHNGKESLLNIELPLFKDGLAKPKFADNYFDAPYDLTDIDIRCFEDTLILKMADNFVYVIERDNYLTFDGNLDVLNIMNDYVLFDSRKNEIIIPSSYYTARSS